MKILIRPSRAFACAVLGISSLLVPTTTRADVGLAVDWGLIGGPVSRDQTAVNVWKGMQPGYASAFPGYAQNLAYLAPEIVRLHAGEQIDEGDLKSWIDYPNRRWNAATVTSVLDGLPASADRILLTITGWPTWMADSSNPGRLNPSKVQEYANFCASLVTIVRNHGVTVQFWEPFNEKDDRYQGAEAQLAAIQRACYDAMKAADPNISVGAAAWHKPWRQTEIANFLRNVDGRIDFFSYHMYGLTRAATSNADLIDSVDGIVSWTDTLARVLRAEGYGDLPLWLDETNGFASYDLDLSQRRMNGAAGLVFDARLYKSMIEGQDIDGMFHWNESDGVYGKMDSANGNHAVRPAGHLLHLANTHFGDWFARATSSNPGAVEVLATTGGSKFTVLVTNRSSSSQQLDFNFAGWSPSMSGYTEYRVTGSGLATAARTWSGAPQNVSLPALSVLVLVFSDTSGSVVPGRQAYGGTPAALPGRLEAEEYDTGGDGLGYRDMDRANGGGAFRDDRVDVYSNVAGTDPGGIRVGHFEAGEFLAYTVAPQAGLYDLQFRVSSKWGVTGDVIRVLVDGVEAGVLSDVPKKWNDENFATVTVSGVPIPGSASELKLEFLSDGFGLNYVDFVRTGPLPGYSIYTDGVDAFETEGGTIAKYRMTVTHPTSGAPEGSEFVRIVPSGSYPYYAHAFPSARNKTDWATGTLTFSMKTTDGSYAAYLEDASGTRIERQLNLYGRTDGTWNEVAIPVATFAGIDLSSLVRVGFRRTWSTSKSLELDNIRVEGGGTANAPNLIESETYDRKSSAITDVAGGAQVPSGTTGTWLEYDGIAAQAGTYRLTLRYASHWGGQTVAVKLNGQTVGMFPSLTQTWNDASYREAVIENVTLPATANGTLRIEPSNGKLTLDYLEFQ